MRKMFVAAAAVIALAAFSAPASAATLVLDQSGTNLAEMIHSNGTQSGTSLNLVSAPSAFSINYSSSDSLSVTGNGVAQVDGSSGGFTDVTIAPLSNIAFTAFKFNLGMPGKGGYTGAFTFDAMLTFVGGATQTFDNFVAGNGNGANRFTFAAQGSELINQIFLSDLEAIYTKNSNGSIISGPVDFDNIKQASFNFDAVSGVPEPATWAEFILGFGAIGVALRRRRCAAGLPHAV
jgi:hypothetical protein